MGEVKLLGTPLSTLKRDEWEALCDGCGQCCLHKVEDEDTGDIYHTNVACKLLDLRSARCSDYKNRRNFVPDCVRLTPRLAHTLPWLPDSCAYRLRAEDLPLPEWHYLVCGDRDAVHRAGARDRQGDQRGDCRAAAPAYHLGRRTDGDRSGRG
jgi:uncharacterized cysteine cluster protein YcgN (CxxCxxCC family)